MKRRRRGALSTGDAARYCLVTSDTILNWIKHSHLPARRTLGGQFRILPRDLRGFLVDQGMETDLLDSAYDVRRYCWELRESAGVCPIQASSCEDCLARRVLAQNCYELRAALAESAEDLDVCMRCRYLAEFRLGPGSRAHALEELSGGETAAP